MTEVEQARHGVEDHVPTYRRVLDRLGASPASSRSRRSAASTTPAPRELVLRSRA